MSGRAQRMSGSVTTATPSLMSRGSGGFCARAVMTRLGRAPLGKAKSRGAEPRVTWR